MDEIELKELMRRVADGHLSPDDAARELRHLPYADLGFAKIDHHREMRAGVAEAVYGPGKTPQDAAAICEELFERSTGAVLVTKASVEQFDAIKARLPQAVFDTRSGVVVVRKASNAPDGVVVVACAGTADLPVAEEAAIVTEALGLKVERLKDVGVAGLHRLLSSRDALDRADVIVAVAGMDGALPTIIGGLVSVPVIAVPTSVGYGAGAGGIAPLLTMLNTCAPGIAVVNIDNGYGAAVFAASVLRTGSTR